MNSLTSLQHLVSTLMMATLLVGVGLTGCSNNSISEIEDLETVSLYSQTNQLAQTMEYIRSLDRYEISKFRDKVNSGLNRWMTSQDTQVAGNWKLPSVTESLPEVIKTETVFSHIDDTTFLGNDADYVQQVYWFREIANRISKSNFVAHQEYLFQVGMRAASPEERESWRDSDNLLLDAMTTIHSELVDEDAASGNSNRLAKLVEAIKLFDWSVRNVHLVEEKSWPDAETVQSMALVENSDPNEWPALTGTPGPGYVRFPWQTLTYGKGDFLDRARIFAGLCHQMDIPVAILAVPADDTSGRPYIEWLCGAVIGEEIYLFDPLLGLPIHGTRQGSIATLTEVKTNPELLNGLDLTIEESVEQMNYRVTADMLDHVTALIYAAPEAISKRMAAVEENLSGELRLKLTVDADALATAWKVLPGISDVQLWHVPFSNQIYREHVAQALITATYDQNVMERIAWLQADEAYVDSFVMLRTARNCFLQGVFQNIPDKSIRSAISYYYGFMYTDQEISEVERDPGLQRRLGIVKGADQDFQDWQLQMKLMKRSMAQIRADAAFFLAMCNYENGFPSTSIKWMKQNATYDNDDRWSVYLDYHMGRSFEADGDYEKAAGFYGADKSAQKHGSLLRKRLMESLLENSSKSS